MIDLGVIHRRHHTQSTRKSSSLHTLCLCVALSDAFPPAFPLVYHLPYLLPSSVSCKSFACHSCEKCRGVCHQFPFWNSPFINRHYAQIPSFQILPHSFAISCTFLRSRKTQLSSFQALPHSLQKNRGVGVPPQPSRGPGHLTDEVEENEIGTTTDISLLPSSAWFPAVPGRAVPPIGHPSPSSQSKPGGLYP